MTDVVRSTLFHIDIKYSGMIIIILLSIHSVPEVPLKRVFLVLLESHLSSALSHCLWSLLYHQLQIFLWSSATHQRLRKFEMLTDDWPIVLLDLMVLAFGWLRLLQALQQEVAGEESMSAVLVAHWFAHRRDQPWFHLHQPLWSSHFSAATKELNCHHLTDGSAHYLEPWNSSPLHLLETELLGQMQFGLGQPPKATQ